MIRSTLRTRFWRTMAAGSVLALLAGGCGSDSPVQPDSVDFQPLLVQAVDGVIIPTYADLASQSAALHAAVLTLQSQPTTEHLTEARDAWRQARRPWEMSEGFLFGPVDTQGIDPAIDSWPVNHVDLEAVLASSDVLTPSFIDALEGTLKGFHTIEYLLYGEDGGRVIGELQPRVLEYLAACSGALAGATERLRLAWDPAGGDFGQHLRAAGSASSVYSSPRAAVQELVNGMVGIADEVANGKINDPLSTGDLTLEESRFSANSKADFADNIRSIQHIYLGRYTSDGIGLDEFVRSRNAALDSQLQAEIAAAITAIEAIPGTFSSAVQNARPAVEAAQDAVLQVSQTLQAEVMPLVVGP
jgi:predicted lipoprotein